MRNIQLVRTAAGTMLAAGLMAGTLFGQAKSEDRRLFLNPSVNTTDDPRRIPLAPRVKGPEGVLVLRGGTIFDSVKQAGYAGTLVIEHNRIRAILAPDSKDWPANARVVDVTGRTVLPGLIDLHSHLTNPGEGTPVDEQSNEASATLWALQNLRVLLEDGITSVRDLGSLEMVPFVLKEWAAENRIPSPRLFVAGKIITGTGGHGTERPLIAIHTPPFRREASGPDDWRNAVREAFKRGADVIKISSHFSEPEARAAAEEAHALGLKITCDCETYYIPMAVRAGVDIIEHPLPRTPEAIQLMAEHGVASDPTLVVYLRMLEKTGGYYSSTSRRFTLTRSGILDTFVRMKAAGIKAGIGTDTSSTSILAHGSQYLAELKAFVENGYTIPQALIAATRTGAEILDMQDKLGTLEPGKLADVLVVEGRPDQNLDDLKRIDLVIRDGYLVVEKGHVTIPRHSPVAF